MKKNLWIAVSAICVIAAMVFALVSCYDADGKYFEKVSSYTFWTNKGDQAIPQKAIHDIVMEHMTGPDNGKVKKTAVIGFDGARAQALVNVLKSGVLDKDGNDIYSGDFFDTGYSAINSVINDGGNAYICYSGGEKGNKETQQYTSTAPSWTAQMTGVWGKKNGVVNNNDNKIIDYKTYLMKLAESEKKYKTVFASSWSTHFTHSYVDEINYLEQHKDVDMLYNRVNNDEELLDYYMKATSEGTPEERDVILGIFEHTDHMGHAYTFGNENYKYAVAMRHTDNIAFTILENIKGRENYANEDWLIIMTTDHGGLGYSHGGQSLEERTTWMVTNKTLDTKYYSNGYNGYTTK